MCVCCVSVHFSISSSSQGEETFRGILQNRQELALTGMMFLLTRTGLYSSNPFLHSLPNESIIILAGPRFFHIELRQLLS